MRFGVALNMPGERDRSDAEVVQDHAPQHVAEAVLFLVARRTPTTGATIPVDGGLPDATPR